MRSGRRCRLLLLLIALVAIFVGAARAEEADDEACGSGMEDDADDDDAFDEEDVLVLTKENFDKTIKGTEYVLAEFYAPWCGYCKQLAPEYATAATMLEDFSNVVLAKIDATQETELAEAHGVEGYPTLKWFVNGTAHEYGGGRDAEGIARWVKKMTGPVGITIDTVDALGSAEKQDEAVLIGYFKELSESDASFAKYVEAAIDVDLPILQTTSADVAKAAGNLAVDSIALILNVEGNERKVVKYTGAIEGTALRKFATLEALPLVVPFNNANSEVIFGNEDIQRHLLLIGRASDVKPGSKLFKQFEQVSSEMRAQQEFVFVSVDADDEEGEPVMEFFNIGKSDLPMLWGFQFHPEQRKYRFTGDVKDSAAVKKFAEGIIAGKVEPEFLSEDVPDNDVDNDVRVVVGKSFDNIVKDSKKDVLLEVYAPWCGHCKTLAPIYEQLGARFKGVDSVVIAKMDGTTNEHPSLDVEGFPSLYFFPAGDKSAGQVIEYEDDRTLEALTKFVQENAKTKFDLKIESADAPSTDDARGSSKDEL